MSPLWRWAVQGAEPASPIVMPGHAEPTIYDVGPGGGGCAFDGFSSLVQAWSGGYKTAEHVRRVAEQRGYRTGRMERVVSQRGTQSSLNCRTANGFRAGRSQMPGSAQWPYSQCWWQR